MHAHGEGGWSQGGVPRSLSQPSSYLPFVPFDPFPSTRFIVSFTLLRPGKQKQKKVGEGC